MPEGKIALRQLLCLLFAALLSPTVRVLPGRTAAAAGAAGWLCTLTALPVLLGLCWVLFALFRTAGPEDGLAQIFQRALGRLPGKALALLYLLWGLCLLCVNARLFALRLLSTSYRNAPLKLFLVVLLAVALWLARKKLPALVRAGEIFYLALSLCLGVVLFLGLFRVEPQNVLPVWVQDVPEVLRGTLPALSVVGYVIFGAFLGGGVARKEGNRRRAMRWAAVFCLVLTLLQWVCLGAFGPGLTQRMDTPFFMMVKGVGVEGAFGRVESVVIALWVLADLALLTLLLCSCCCMAQAVFGFQRRESAALPLILLTLAGALFLFPDAFTLYEWIEGGGEAGGLVFGFLLPALVLPVALLRRKRA